MNYHRIISYLYSKGLLNLNQHPFNQLKIYNYKKRILTNNSDYKLLSEVRGLIIDNKDIIAKGFSKIENLNINRYINMDNSEANCIEKLDGALGILYWYNGNPYIATRGSFDSVQACKANSILYNKYNKVLAKLSKSHTYLFEIIASESKIVLDYNGITDLYLISIIDNITLNESRIMYDNCHLFPKPEEAKLNFRTINSLLNDKDYRKEGFIVHFDSKKYKIKSHWYRMEYERLSVFKNYFIDLVLQDYSMNEIITNLKKNGYENNLIIQLFKNTYSYINEVFTKIPCITNDVDLVRYLNTYFSYAMSKYIAKKVNNNISNFKNKYLINLVVCNSIFSNQFYSDEYISNKKYISENYICNTIPL